MSIELIVASQVSFSLITILGFIDYSQYRFYVRLMPFLSFSFFAGPPIFANAGVKNVCTFLVTGGETNGMFGSYCIGLKVALSFDLFAAMTEP